MPPKKLSIIWNAEPHTVAKIDILRAYLVAWFQIMGRSMPKQDILYVDGFAGPGEYLNHPEGSPLAALATAKAAFEQTGNKWIAGNVHCAFIESDSSRFEHLEHKVLSVEMPNTIVTHLYHSPFVEGLGKLRQDVPDPFKSRQPLFVFIDPFGATGVPFPTVAQLLGSPGSEILVNLDADGIARIFQAGKSAAHEVNLNSIFGGNEWAKELNASDPFPDLCRKVLQLYKAKLRHLPRVRYCFSFEMRASASALNYHLVFASQHHLGLEKMKEAMKRMDQDGSYCFSDAKVRQQTLFRFDDPEHYSELMFNAFRRKKATYAQLRDYALNETPFVNPKSVLRVLEVEQDLIEVGSRRPRRKGTFNEDNILWVQFK